MPKLGQYSKSIGALIGVGLTYATQYYGTNHWVVIAVGVASALGVYAVPNQVPNAPKPPPTGM